MGASRFPLRLNAFGGYGAFILCVSIDVHHVLKHVQTYSNHLVHAGSLSEIVTKVYKEFALYRGL